MKYVFDLETSARALRLNRFLHSLTVASKRKLFLKRPEEAMQGLSETEKDMVRHLDWKALQDYGASFFCRSEERRVGKECRCRRSPYQRRKKDESVRAVGTEARHASSVT